MASVSVFDTHVKSTPNKTNLFNYAFCRQFDTHVKPTPNKTKTDIDEIISSLTPT